MLQRIAQLSPGRCYYPPHLRVMQTVHWDNSLSFLSQHGHFITAVKSLLLQAEQATIFHPDAQLFFPSLDKVDEHLLQRDNIRSATFRVSSFGAEDHTTLEDRLYNSRDRDFASQRASRVSTMSRFILREDIALFAPALAAGRLWEIASSFDLINGPKFRIEASSLRYDKNLIMDGHKFVVSGLPALHKCLGTSIATKEHKFSVMMWLSTMAFAPQADLPFLQTVAMFSKSTAMAQIHAPEAVLFQPKEGKSCSRAALRKLVEQHHHPQESCPEHHLRRLPNEKKDDYNSRRNQAWQKANNSATQEFVDSLETQWPCATPKPPEVSSTYIKVHEAMEKINLKFKAWHENKLLAEYFDSLEQAVSGFVVKNINPLDLSVGAPSRTPSVSGYVSEQSILLLPAPDVLPMKITDCERRPTGDVPQEVSRGPNRHKSRHVTVHRLESSPRQRVSGEPALLGSVIKALDDMTSRSKYEKQYVADLSDSLNALLSRDDIRTHSEAVAFQNLASHFESCHEHVQKIYDALLAAVTPSSSSRGAGAVYHQPRVSPTFFLKQLSRNRWHHLTEGWKKCIVEYALSLTALQRAERLNKLNKKEDIINELQNTGHQNWAPAKHPETLLMEVESGFLVREVQTQVAGQMQDPPDGRNAVMQLNMGEGKSSVIVPIVAVTLADGQQLLRVIVAKPQSKQMAQMLISKLGGLLDRRVYYMPISRSLKLDRSAARTIFAM